MTVVHSTAQNTYDNRSPYPAVTIAQMLSVGREGYDRILHTVQNICVKSNQIKLCLIIHLTVVFQLELADYQFELQLID